MQGCKLSTDSRQWLAVMNFFMADVRDGLGAFLGVYLLAQSWQADDIGYVMTIGGLATMLAGIPAGALMDRTHAKRLWLSVCAILMVMGCLVLLLWHSFVAIALSQAATGVVRAMIGPAIASISLGLVGAKYLPRQLGQNEAWSHAGSLVSVSVAGVLGYFWGLSAVFVLLAVMAVLALMCIRRIRPKEIDYHAARGLAAHAAVSDSGHAVWAALLQSRPLLMLASIMMLFHLANAAMLPLLGQAMVAQGLVNASLFTALTVMIAQCVMIPMALLAGRYAEQFSYERLVKLALLALPLRGVIASSWNSPWAVVPVQLLDGVGAGLLGVALPGLVAKMLQGSGHFNVGLGFVLTIQGLGAALSPAIAGWVAQRYGYALSFTLLTGFAVLALLLWWQQGKQTSAQAAERLQAGH
ncbi:MAG TPA: MFS transporter [Methylophilus sp.]|nr:MFS transporter [Methylophilus sp.]